MNIACTLVTNGNFKNVVIPEELLVELVKSLRNNGKEIVHLANESLEVEGLYISAKDSKTSIMVIPDVNEQ